MKRRTKVIVVAVIVAFLALGVVGVSVGGSTVVTPLTPTRSTPVNVGPPPPPTLGSR